MIAWHYTTREKYELIRESGILLPAAYGVEPPELPILWFSTHPKFEPTAIKPAMDAEGNVRELTLDELYQYAGGLFRFGCHISRLRFGENSRKAARMKSICWRRLAKDAASLKGNAKDWWGYVGSLPLSEVSVEMMDAEMRWRSVVKS